MATGWGRVGEALAGMSPGNREARVQKQLGDLVSQGIREQQLKQAMMKTGALEGADVAYANLHNPDTESAGLGALLRAGVERPTLSLGDLLQQGYRREAVDAAKASGKFTDYNAPLVGLVSKPLETQKIAGGNIVLDQYSDAPAIFPTEQGQAQIQASQARGQAALIRANKPAATRGGGSKTPTKAGAEAAVLADARAAIAAGASKEAVQRRLRERGYSKLAGSL